MMGGKTKNIKKSFPLLPNSSLHCVTGSVVKELTREFGRIDATPFPGKLVLHKVLRDLKALEQGDELLLEIPLLHVHPTEK